MQMLNNYLRKTVVGSHYFEICALLGARDQDQAYEWSAHETGAQRVGVDQAVIDAIKFRRDTKGLPEKDALVIQFGRALLTDHRVSSELYAKVVEQFGRQGLTELTAIMADYVAAAIMLNAVDQQLPPDRKPLLPPR
jgi:4-carboxymuconolactone decarboxylase